MQAGCLFHSVILPSHSPLEPSSRLPRLARVKIPPQRIRSAVEKSLYAAIPGIFFVRRLLRTNDATYKREKNRG
jgi:hypothetical protein